MNISCVQLGEGNRHQSPTGPIAEVLVGEEPGCQIGAVHLTVPAGHQMGLHGHGASETLLIPLHGSVRLIGASDADEVVMLEPGVIVTIPVGEKVRLDNPEAEAGRMLVVFSPPEFVSRLTRWPLAEAEEADVPAPLG